MVHNSPRLFIESEVFKCTLRTHDLAKVKKNGLLF